MKPGVIFGREHGTCWFCGEHTHHGSPGWPPPNGSNIVCPYCLQRAIRAAPEYGEQLEQQAAAMRR